ncbi:MAG: LptA/OstA family protein [Kangiellaceae bacterium]
MELTIQKSAKYCFIKNCFAKILALSFAISVVAHAVESTLDTTSKNTNIKEEQVFPINFYSDSTTMDGVTREIKNCGNAKINQGDIILLADCLVAKKNDGGDYKYFKATGKPASLEITDKIKNEYLFLSADNIFYDVLKREFTATNNAKLILSSGKNSQSSPDRLNIQSHKIIIQNKSDKDRMIEAEGAPVELAIRSEGDIELNAKSLYLSFSTDTSELNLMDKVEAELALGKITAGEFKYNHKTKQSSFKKAKDGGQIEIVQNPKSETQKQEKNPNLQPNSKTETETETETETRDNN